MRYLCLFLCALMLFVGCAAETTRETVTAVVSPPSEIDETAEAAEIPQESEEVSETEAEEAEATPEMTLETNLKPASDPAPASDPESEQEQEPKPEQEPEPEQELPLFPVVVLTNINEPSAEAIFRKSPALPRRWRARCTSRCPKRAHIFPLTATENTTPQAPSRQSTANISWSAAWICPKPSH